MLLWNQTAFQVPYLAALDKSTKKWQYLCVVFLASEVSSNLTTVMLLLLFLGFLRLISVILQKKSESGFSKKPKGVHMLTNKGSQVKKCVVSFGACVVETVWAAAVAVMVTLTGDVQGNLALAKNIRSN